MTQRRKPTIDWLVVLSFLTGSLLASILLIPTKALLRFELQSIDQRFEQRAWFQWSQEGLRRLNPVLLWQYHEQHEDPPDLLHWDYTLSWLLEPNLAHPVVPIVIFNRLPEDEPPSEALQEMPWLKPLMHYPVSRATMAEWIHTLRKAGVKSILLDEDFSVASDEDAILARELVNAHTGRDGEPQVPVFFVRNLVRQSGPRISMLQREQEPGSLKDALEAETGKPVNLDEYAGISILIPDQDQEVRRILLRVGGSFAGSGDERNTGGSTSAGSERNTSSSVALLVANASGFNRVQSLPETLNIDFIAPPNSSSFPVRSLTYLVDPQRRQELFSADSSHQDVKVKNAIVIVGDGLDDLFNTPLTHSGLNQMSGSEILAQAIDTILSGEPPTRTDDQFDGVRSLAVCAIVSIAGTLLWSIWCSITRSRLVNRASSKAVLDILFIISLLLGFQLVCAVIFAQVRMILPMVTPSVALLSGSIVAALAERNRERTASLQSQLALSEQKLIAKEKEHALELSKQAAEAEALRIVQDQRRRRDFIMRINHDLNAPVTVLNWALADLQQSGDDPKERRESIDILMHTSDRLCMLLDEISKTYEDGDSVDDTVIDVRESIADSVKMLDPVAKARESRVDCNLPDEPVYVRGTPSKLVRVFDNLIRNALRHNPSGTRVHVSMNGTSETAAICVSDNGSGIPESKRKLIFQTDSKHKLSEEKGHGLGLGIVKSLINELNGEIRLDEEVTTGCCFRITLPRVQTCNDVNPSETPE